MTKKIISVMLLLVFALSCAGCSGAMRRKFVRKKKGEAKSSPVLVPEDYEKEFTNRQSYANHFTFWKNAESELISAIKYEKSRKKVETYAAYSMEELEKLSELLIEAKQKEIMPFIEELKNIVSDIRSNPNYVDSHKNLLLRRLKIHYYATERRFPYFSMQRYIRPDEEEKNTQAVQEKPEETRVNQDSYEPAGRA